MAEKKIVCLGAGSLYFLRALPDLMLCEDLAGSEIVLYDIDGEKVQRMGNKAGQLAELAGTRFKIRSPTDMCDAIEDADFAICDGPHIETEKID